MQFHQSSIKVLRNNSQIAKGSAGVLTPRAVKMEWVVHLKDGCEFQHEKRVGKYETYPGNPQ